MFSRKCPRTLYISRCSPTFTRVSGAISTQSPIIAPLERKMAFRPDIFSHWWGNREPAHRHHDHHFGFVHRPCPLMTPFAEHIFGGLPLCLAANDKPMTCPMVGAGYRRPWAELVRKGEGGSSTVEADKDKFYVMLDVQQFAPEEVSVKVVDGYVVVEGKHEEKQDEHGWISRQFTRRYMVPKQCDIDQVSSKLSSDGILSITVPRKQDPAIDAERVIDIERTGKTIVSEATTAVETKEPVEEGRTD